MDKIAWIRRSSILAFSLLAMNVASATPAPSQSSIKGLDVSNALGLPEIKVEMAESRLKLNPSPQALNDLVIALEELLNSKCMTKLPQTLTYPGNPSDPICIARMQRSRWDHRSELCGCLSEPTALDFLPELIK
jgi:hypothetical protein